MAGDSDEIDSEESTSAQLSELPMPLRCCGDSVDVDLSEFLCGVCEDGCEDHIDHTSVSVVGSPLFTDDDRRGLPALYHQDTQGGNPESKHEEF